MQPYHYKDQKGLWRYKKNNKLQYNEWNLYYCNIFQLVVLLFPRYINHVGKMIKDFANFLKEMLIWLFGLFLYIGLFPIMYIVVMFVEKRKAKRSILKKR